jgi:hypothetical protein
MATVFRADAFSYPVMKQPLPNSIVAIIIIDDFISVWLQLLKFLVLLTMRNMSLSRAKTIVYVDANKLQLLHT